jgi:hypothetical protein
MPLPAPIHDSISELKERWLRHQTKIITVFVVHAHAARPRQFIGIVIVQDDDVEEGSASDDTARASFYIDVFVIPI